jgi:hypothetical protein
MSFVAEVNGIEAIAGGFTIASGPSINPISPTAFAVQQWNGGLTVNVIGPADSAAVGKIQLPLTPGPSNFSLTYQIRPSMAAAQVSQCHETDLIIVGPDGSWYNGSCQLNNAEGGMWQIANASGAWVDTGFKPGLLIPEQWVTIIINYQINWTAKTLSVISITDGSQVFQIPTSLQNIPAKTGMGWAPNIIVLQLQDCLNASGGAYTRDMTGINLTMS